MWSLTRRQGGKRSNAERLVASRTLDVLAVVFVQCLIAGWLLRSPAAAQDYLQGIGRPTFSSIEPVELGFVNAANGNLHLEIPLGSFLQRGNKNLTYKLVYDSRIWNLSGAWYPNYSQSMGSWRFVTSVDTGSLGYNSWTSPCWQGNMQTGTAFGYNNFYWTAPDGTQRYFDSAVTTSGVNGSCPGSNPNSTATGYATDSSGYYISINNYNNVVSVLAPGGTQVYPKPYKDSNGNYYTVDANGNIISDTLGRTPVTVTSNCNGNSNQTCYSVLNSQGTSRSTITLTTASVPVHTAFGVPFTTEYNQNITVLTNIALPDGTSYQFTYDQGSTSGHYGEITGITLPTLGTISYSYSVYSDALGHTNHWVSQRTSGGGTWTYALNSVNTSAKTQNVTVTQPSADSKTYSFSLANGAWRNSVAYSSGMTITTSWDTSNTCAAPCVGPINVRKQGETITLITPTGNVSKQTQYTYNGQFPSTIKEWNYGGGTNPTRITNITYLSDGNPTYIAANIMDRPSKIIVTDGSGNKIKETDYAYDSTTLSSQTGVVQHDDTNFGTTKTVRGNRTSISQWTSGTSYLTTATLYYDMTGQMVQAKDASNNSTTFDYTDCYLTGNPPSNYIPSPRTNAYLTTTTLPISGQLKACYYFNTGKTAWTKDQNGATTSHFFINSGGNNDPFDREITETLPIGWALNNYTSQTQLDTYLGIQDATASTACSSCRHDETVRDNLGRPTDQYLVSDPDGQTRVHSDYDSSGRVLDTSHPYRTTGDSTYGLETVAYDAQNRPSQVTHQDGAIGKTYYGSKVSSAGGLTTQQCPGGTCNAGYPTLSVDEAGKMRQVWTDAFGKVVEVDEQAANANTSTAGTSTGTVTISGTEQSVNECPNTPPYNCWYYDNGGFSATVGGVSSGVSYSQGSTAASLASALASAFNSNPASPATASASGTVITFTAKFNYSLSVSATSWNSGLFASPSFTASGSGGALTGSVSPPMASPTVTYYLYDALSRLQQVTVVGSGECNRTYTYDNLSRMTSSTEPEPGNGTCASTTHTTNYYYTTAGGAACSGDLTKVCRRTDGRSITSNYTYDVLNRPTGMTYTNDPSGTPTVAYSYDQTTYNGLTITNGAGRRTGMSDGSGTTAWSYDLNGNIVTEKRTIAGITKSISYAYNKDNSLKQLTYASGRIVNFTVSNAERTTAAVDSTGTQYAIAPSSGAMYAPPGGLASAVYGKGSVFTGLTESRAYNNRLQLTGITGSSTAGTALNLAYTFSGTNHANNGEILSVTNNVDTGRTENNTFDALGRITSSLSQATSGGDCWGQNFTFDAVANLTNIGLAQCSSTSFSAAVNGNNQFTTGYTYDAAGNLTNDGIYTYAYNAENEITSANGVTYNYDGNRMRVKKSSGTLYWRDVAGNTIAETNLSGTTTNEYVFFEGRRAVQRDSSGNNYYYQADQIGSTRSITKVTSGGSASICYDADFTPYGSEMAHTNTCAPNYKFTGYERDSETGLDYAFNRYYNSRMGRFMSSDPLGPAASNYDNPQSMNRYAYVLNNPMSFTDPRGLDCVYLGDDGTYDGNASIDTNSNAGECADNGGTWFNGSVDPANLDIDPDSNWVGLTDSNGNVMQASCTESGTASNACSMSSLADMGSDYAGFAAGANVDHKWGCDIVSAGCTYFDQDNHFNTHLTLSWMQRKHPGCGGALAFAGIGGLATFGEGVALAYAPELGLLELMHMGHALAVPPTLTILATGEAIKDCQ